MATPTVQQFAQSVAQANSPFIANNGNPGTVYNMPGTGSYKPPMASALNQWALNPTPVSQYANNPFWLQTTQQPIGGMGGFVVPPLTTIPGSVIPNNPTTPPTTPPITTPNGGGGNGGSIVDPNYPLNGVGNNWSGGVGPSLIGTSGSNYTHTVGGGGGSLSNIVNTVGGNFRWQDVLDAFLPGDLYDSESGTWDLTNAVAEALNYVVPGLGDAAQFAANNGLLGQTIQDLAFNESYRQFEARQRNNVNDAVGNAMNTMDQRVANTLASRLAARQNAFNPGGVGWNSGFNSGFGAGQISPITGQSGGLGSSPFDGGSNSSGSTINERMTNWGAGGIGAGSGRDSRSGRSADSGTVATGQAAIDIASGLRDASNAAMFASVQQQMRDMIKIQ